MSVREGLLSLLEEGPNYGFQLKTQFEAATGGTWALNVGQVYTTLDRLERDGLVSVEEDEGQKVYRLTDAGHDELDRWWTSVPTDGPPPRDDMLIKLLLALPHGRDHALGVLTRQRTALVQILQSRRSAAAKAATRPPIDGTPPANRFAASLVADAVLMRTEADLRWLDRCEARIAGASAAELAHLTTDPDDPSDPAHSSPGTPAGSPTSRRTRAARIRRTRP